MKLRTRIAAAALVTMPFVAAVAVAPSASAATTTLAQVRPMSATGCTQVGEYWISGSDWICLHVQGSGLYVDYAYGEPRDSGDPGVIYDTDGHMARHYVYGETRVYVERDLPSGDRICYEDETGGYYSSRACETIH